MFSCVLIIFLSPHDCFIRRMQKFRDTASKLDIITTSVLIKYMYVSISDIQKKKFFSLEYFCFFCFWNSEIKEKLFSCTRNRFGLGLFYMFPRSCCFCLLCKTLLWHASLILSARKRTETYIYSNFLMFIFSFSSSKTFRLYSKELGK